jgi:hypothetical protein
VQRRLLLQVPMSLRVPAVRMLVQQRALGLALTSLYEARCCQMALRRTERHWLERPALKPQPESHRQRRT